jgi:chloramphenicol-sensitive protein RarD
VTHDSALERSRHLGIWYGLAAYAIWGLFPLYWKLLRHVPALQVLGHRIAWSFVALVILTLGVRRFRAVASADVERAWPPGVIAIYTAASLLIGLNWFLYVWAVNAGFVIETSLGYFMTPLVNVLLGVIVFRERLRAAQWIAVALAGFGVLHLTRAYGSLPWIAVGLATSFGGYGLLKKKAPLGTLDGLTLETAILFLPAVAYLAWLDTRGEAAFLHTGLLTGVLLASGGIITIVPLLLFTASVQRIPLSVVGLLQYIAPTIQLLLGVLLFHEPFTQAQVIGFSFVWMALVVFATDGLRNRR